MEKGDRTEQSLDEYLNSKEGKRNLFLLYTFYFLTVSGILARIMLFLDSMVVKLVAVIKGN